jgi:alpha-beta hydrolase superfamily lysophospholipase
VKKFVFLHSLCSLFVRSVSLRLRARALLARIIPSRRTGGSSLKQDNGSELRADAKAGVLIVHDYFGISDATKHSAEHLGALGYRAIAVDLYGGKSATSHEEALKLMQALDRNAAGKILQTGLDYLKQPGRKLATLGFSMGGLESLNGESD